MNTLGCVSTSPLETIVSMMSLVQTDQSHVSSAHVQRRANRRAEYPLYDEACLCAIPLPQKHATISYTY